MTKSIFLQPELIIPVGKLAIAQFLAFEKLDEVVGRSFQMRHNRRAFDLIPLPHPSGASPWHRMPPGLGLAPQSHALNRAASRHAGSFLLQPDDPASKATASTLDVRRWTLDVERFPSFTNDYAKILTRADLPDSDKWDLTHLFTGAG